MSAAGKPKQPPNGQPELADRGIRVLKEYVTHILALSLVAIYLALLMSQLWRPSTDLDSVAVAKEIGTILSPLVAVVLGFYFGERSGASRGEAAQAHATIEMKNVKVTVTETLQAGKQKLPDIDQLEKYERRFLERL